MAKTKPKPEDWLHGDNLLLLKGWCMRGLTAEQIYTNMGIPKSTFYDWTNRCSEFSAIIKSHREVCNVTVENALYEQCKKGNVAAMIFYLKNRMPKDWKDKIEQVSDETAINTLQEILNGLKTKAVDNS